MAPFLALLALGLSGLATPEAGRVSAPGEAASALRARLAARASADPFSEVSAHAPFGTSDSDSDADAEADLERDLLQALRQPGPSKVGAVLAQGVQAFTLGLAPLLRDPPAWEEGMRVLNGEFWKVVLLLVPEQHHWSREMSRAKSAWDAAFVQTPEITWDVAKFRSTGDTAALTRAFKSVIYLAVKLVADALAISRVAPQMGKYFDAILDLVDGVGASWDLHAAGQTAEAAEGVWRAVKVAADDLVPKSVASGKTYSLIVGTVDGVVSNLTQHVLEYKRRIMTSKLCYKRSLPRERTRPSSCREGFDWDQVHTCYPSVSNGADCFGPCGGSGMCPSFCGPERACCRRGGAGDAIECKGSSGFVDLAYTKGSSRDYNQCVQPGPAVSFRIVSSGEPELVGLWVRDGAKSGRPRYTLAGDRRAILEWSESRAAWRLYIDETWLGYGRPTLYTSAETSRTVPLTGWQAVDGVEPLPRIELFERSAAASFVQASALETSLMGKGPSDFGTHEATCDLTRQDLEKAGDWCVGKCPAGYRPKNAHTCEQECGGSHPAESMGMCGTSPEEVYAVVAQGAVMVSNGAVKSYLLIDDMRKTGVEAEKLSGTVNTFIDMGKPFAHPRCPEFDDAA